MGLSADRSQRPPRTPSQAKRGAIWLHRRCTLYPSSHTIDRPDRRSLV